MDKTEIANEIEKYLYAHPNIRKIFKPQLEWKDDGFYPHSFEKFSILEDTIEKVEKNIIEPVHFPTEYIFSGEGNMKFDEPATNCPCHFHVKFGGSITLDHMDERMYAKEIVITYITK